MSDDIVDFNQWGSHVPRMPRIPRMPGPLLRVAAGLVAAIVLLTTTFYQVPPEAVGVVLRFGRYVRTAEPGLHLKAPFAEEVIKVPVQRQLKQEFGFRTEEAVISPTQYAKGNFNDESMMLTGDLNVAIVEWIVQDPRVGVPIPLQSA